MSTHEQTVGGQIRPAAKASDTTAGPGAAEKFLFWACFVSLIATAFGFVVRTQVMNDWAREFGFKTVGCASTGNLANSVAANAAASGLESYIFIPADLERVSALEKKVHGSMPANTISAYGAWPSLGSLASLPNTTVKTTIVRNGRTTAQATPRAACLYST